MWVVAQNPNPIAWKWLGFLNPSSCRGMGGAVTGKKRKEREGEPHVVQEARGPCASLPGWVGETADSPALAERQCPADHEVRSGTPAGVYLNTAPAALPHLGQPWVLPSAAGAVPNPIRPLDPWANQQVSPGIHSVPRLCILQIQQESPRKGDFQPILLKLWRCLRDGRTL